MNCAAAVLVVLDIPVSETLVETFSPFVPVVGRVVVKVEVVCG